MSDHNLILVFASVIIAGAALCAFSAFDLGVQYGKRPDSEKTKAQVLVAYDTLRRTYSERPYLLDGEVVYLVRRKDGYQRAYEEFRASFGSKTRWMGSDPERYPTLKVEEPSE